MIDSLKAEEIKQRGVEDFPQIVGWNEKYSLTKYQIDGAAWLFFIRRGILSDIMGAGKTLTAFALILLCRTLGEQYKTVVVCESNVQDQWVAECQKFTDLKIVNGSGDPNYRHKLYNSSWDVLVTSYALLLRDYDLLKSTKPDIIIFDESTHFRHGEIKTHRLACGLSEGISRVILLDGTPIQTSLLDIFHQLEVLHLGIFGSQDLFESKYTIKEFVKVKRGRRVYEELQIVRYKNLDDFRIRLSPFILRRKKEVSQLPDVVVEDKWLDLLPAQKKIYDSVRKDRVEEFRNGRFKALKEHFHLLQFAADTTAPFSNDKPESSKLDYVINRLRNDLANETVVIFNRYREVLEAYRDGLRAAGFACGILYGKMKLSERSKVLSDFRSGKIQVLLGTQAIERGLNLQTSAYLIATNELDNPKRMEQLAGRIVRIGSKYRKAYLTILRTRGTLEERRYKRLQRRAALPDAIFSEQNDLYAALTNKELGELIL